MLIPTPSSRQLQHAASWDPTTTTVGGHVAQKLSRDSKNISIGEAVLVPPMNCPAEILEVQPQQDVEVIGASSSDYSNSEDEYTTHIEEEPTPVSDGRLLFCYIACLRNSLNALCD